MLRSEEERAEYVLRVAEEHTLGTAGDFGSDERSFGCGQDLEAFLRSLGLSEETIAKAQAALEQPAAGSQFIPSPTTCKSRSLVCRKRVSTCSSHRLSRSGDMSSKPGASMRGATAGLSDEELTGTPVVQYGHM